MIMEICVFDPDRVCQFTESVLAGLISSGFVVFCLWLFQRGRYWYYLKRRFHNQTFVICWKDLPNRPVQSAKIKVSGNVMTFTGISLNNKENPFDGSYVINPINLRYGEGYHIHRKSDGFGFHRMVIKDDSTFFVEAPYTSMKEDSKTQAIKRGRIYQAFVWKKESHDEHEALSEEKLGTVHNS